MGSRRPASSDVPTPVASPLTRCQVVLHPRPAAAKLARDPPCPQPTSCNEPSPPLRPASPPAPPAIVPNHGVSAASGDTSIPVPPQRGARFHCRHRISFHCRLTTGSASRPRHASVALRHAASIRCTAWRHCTIRACYAAAGTNRISSRNVHGVCNVRSAPPGLAWWRPRIRRPIWTVPVTCHSSRRAALCSIARCSTWSRPPLIAGRRRWRCGTTRASCVTPNCGTRHGGWRCALPGRRRVEQRWRCGSPTVSTRRWRCWPAARRGALACC